MPVTTRTWVCLECGADLDIDSEPPFDFIDFNRHDVDVDGTRCPENGGGPHLVADGPSCRCCADRRGGCRVCIAKAARRAAALAVTQRPVAVFPDCTACGDRSTGCSRCADQDGTR